MGSRKVTVTVTWRGTTYDGPLPDRPVRRMPDGVSGVVYQGKVFPLRADGTIDVDDPSADKSACTTFVTDSDPVVHRPGGQVGSGLSLTRWGIESNRYGSYVVLDGSEREAEAAVARLQAAGLGVRRWDASFRPASDGHQYDWFVRLQSDDSPAECRTRVAAAFAAPTVDAEPTDDGEHRSADLSARVDLLVEEQKHIHELLDLAQEVSAATRLENEQLRRELESAGAERERARAASARARGEKETAEAAWRAAEARAAALSEQLAGGGADEVKQVWELAHTEEQLRRAAEQERDDTRRLVADAEERAAEAEAHVTRLSARLEREAAERVATDERLATVQAALGALPRERGRNRRRSRRSLVERLWPRLILDQSAVELLDDPETAPYLADVAMLLCRLQAGESVPQKVWTRHGARVHQVGEHVRIGRSAGADLGRLYYREAEDGRLVVYLHRKCEGKDQKHFVERISRSALPDVDPF